MARNKNGSPAKRDKRRDKLKVLRNNAHLANDFIMWSIDGCGAGVKWVRTLQDTKVSSQEEFLLMTGKYRFNVVVGAVGRDETNKEWFICEDLLSEKCTGKELTPRLIEHATALNKQIGKANLLTSFYFASTDPDFEFTDEMIYSWLEERNVFKDLITWREHTTNCLIDIGEYMTKNFDQHQVGGSHYSKLTIQPRHIFNELQLPWDIANAVKYVVRFMDKNGEEDLKKAWDYIARCRCDGLEKFKQKRLLKAQCELFANFAKQFKTPVENLLNNILASYTAKYESESDFEAVMDSILFEIDTMCKAIYGNNTH